MDGFLNWFFAFMTTMIDGIWRIFKNLFLGIVQIFNLPAHFDTVNQYKADFGVIGWILCVFCFLLVFAIWGILIFMLVLVIRKYIRFRKGLVGNEDLLEEIADLHADVVRLTKDRERIMAIKVGQAGLSMEQINELFLTEEDLQTPPETTEVDPESKRFFRLSAVDDKYANYYPPEYDASMDLAAVCEDLRNYACSKMRLYYEIKTIRLMLAGLASTKLILLQGISGTGKTSLPYCMGKYFQNDATIAAVQPSWRDRTELFGYFNEFTKKFNETEVLKRIYESGYNEDINIIVLDEMNIARVEYYFAEMLSVLEMPNASEWKLSLVTASWPNDPKKLVDGFLTIPENVWYIGTANNDDSTFAVSDKVYDRALVINLDSKGVAFDAPVTEAKKISYSYISALYDQATEDFPVSSENHEKIQKLDMYVIQKFRVAFGNRIIKQLGRFVPVYVACGGSEIEGIDYLLATKVFRKFESLNLPLIRDEIDGLKDYLDQLFGKGAMEECLAYLDRLKKMY